MLLSFAKPKAFPEDAQSILILSANLKFDAYLTAKAITDIYYLTHRLTHSEEKTRDVLTMLCLLFHLLDTTSLDMQKAVSSEIPDFEDAVKIETAVRTKKDCIVTRNISDYKKLHSSRFIA